ncbi:MAG: amino acid adenylation domain-containing protein, partial [Verrucomicrobia bacterium]|nr:amino acid adenylation domain-containing protein [Verrucomicrobiota bacterium]
MADAQMPWLLTQSSLLGRLPPTGARRICLDQELASIPIGAPGAVSEPEVKPWNLAYTIYTSGSTGRPKGVLITQEAYLSYCGAAIEYWQFKASDRVLQFARFSFDVGIDQLLTPLLAGATVVMRGAEIPDPACFTDIIKKHRITVVNLPPVYWQQWVETLSKGTGGESIGALRLVQVGGDVMPVAAVRRWHELKLRSVRLFNRYGPTETTMFSTAYEVLTEQPADGRATRIPIGRPVGQRTIYILDAQGKPVPIGSTGEIHIGGKTLARGYLNRPELTAERFIPNPFGSEPGARLYRTGDLGRFLPDGNIDFLGRVDFQVKIRGYRIELGEVEVVLGGHSQVAACAVLAQDLGGGDKTLVAFVVGREQAELSAGSLRQ